MRERSSLTGAADGGAGIRILDDDTIAQIAAGEVIERPVSVVKELVENSLDAGATSIQIELVDGGRSAISVTDDGAGMDGSDLPLALARHATSKLRRAGDLFAIGTLGFRGEGLASIAAAGRVEIVSRRADRQIGARIEAAGTALGEPHSAPAPLGTKVVVRDLFALTPARREFLKSPRAEFARVSDFVSKLSLGWPQVAFRLRHDGRDVWFLPVSADPHDRVQLVFGESARAALARIDPDFEGATVKVSGFVSRPGYDRPNRNHQSFFVNGRLVRSSALGAAWLAGYASFGMTGRYPFGTIAVALPARDVDVNVHPTKIEVRFADQRAVFDAVRNAVARTLRSTQPVSAFPASAVSKAPPAEQYLAAERSRSAEAAQPALSELRAPDPDAVRFYGQVDRTYIVAADPTGLILIDQHAAHERIAYEALLDRGAAREPAAALLIPTIVELTPAQLAILNEFAEDIAAAGVAVEHFGEHAYRIVELPGGYERRRFDLPNLLDDLAADDAPREGTARRNRLLATIACHSVIRAHEPLTLQEQAALYRRLLSCRDPHTCPHGRPTMMRLDGQALARAFRRQ